MKRDHTKRADVKEAHCRPIICTNLDQNVISNKANQCGIYIRRHILTSGSFYDAHQNNSSLKDFLMIVPKAPTFGRPLSILEPVHDLSEMDFHRKEWIFNLYFWCWLTGSFR